MIQHPADISNHMTPHTAGVRVLLVDQWIETGGTMKAAIQLVERFGGTVVGESNFW